MEFPVILYKYGPAVGSEACWKKIKLSHLCRPRSNDNDTAGRGGQRHHLAHLVSLIMVLHNIIWLMGQLNCVQWIHYWDNCLKGGGQIGIQMVITRLHSLSSLYSQLFTGNSRQNSSKHS